MSILVPHLENKINALLNSARNPGVISVAQLLMELNISKVTYRSWIKETSRKERLTNTIIEKICSTFSLSWETFLLEDIEVFRDRIRNPDGVMQEVLNEAKIDESQLWIELSEMRGVRLAQQDNALIGKVYKPGQQFRICLKNFPGWSALILLKDPEDWSAVGEELTFPITDNSTVGESKKSHLYEFDNPLGQHFLLAILTQKALDQSLMKKIRHETKIIRFEGFLGISRYLSQPKKNEKALYKLPFSVI